MGIQRFGNSRSAPLGREVDPEPPDAPLRLPLYHHPVVACSLILMAAAVVQIGVWLVNMKLPGQMPGSHSSVVVHGVLLESLRDALSGPGSEDVSYPPALFVAGVLVALSSGLTWYAVARFGLGPRWGLWVGLFWVVHPSFAFLADQPDKLTLLIALVPAAWSVLLWWRRCASIWVALLFGAALALTCLVGFQGVLLLAIALPAMLLSKPVSGGRRFAGVAATALGFAVTLAASLAGIIGRQAASEMASAAPGPVTGSKPTTSRPSGSNLTAPPSARPNWIAALSRASGSSSSIWRSPGARAGLWLWLARESMSVDVEHFIQRLDGDLWNALDDGGGSAVARAARRQMSIATSDRPNLKPHRPLAVRFLVNEYRRAPRDVGRWFAARFWRTIYASGDGRILYPLAVLQFAWLVPALWGFWIALVYRPWRWLALTTGLFVLAHWTLVAIAEPLARNLTPVGGFGVMFALVGITDVYERLFGRRLTSPAPASRSARLRRMQRHLKSDPPL